MLELALFELFWAQENRVWRPGFVLCEKGLRPLRFSQRHSDYSGSIAGLYNGAVKALFRPYKEARRNTAWTVP
jgi:hypothetical protein